MITHNNNGYESTASSSLSAKSNKQLASFYQKIKDPKSAPVRENLEK